MTPRRFHDERGVFLVWFAIMLVTLLAMAGFAVDYWHWNHEESRLQKAADAAALAGAVFLPENSSNVAFNTAKNIASVNGYTDGQNATVTPAIGSRPNQLRVTITETVRNYFASLVGANTTTITKHAIGEYEKPVNLGSPINQYGNDPESGAAHGSQRYPDLWGNVFGPSSYKQKGDAIQAKDCTGSPDNCGSSNTDYDPKGYFYGVEVQPGAVGPLTVQVFDPAFANVGDNCGDNDNGSNLVGAATLAPNFNSVFPVSNPSTRYSPSSSSIYCTGDQYYTEGNNVVPWTTYILRAPDDTPADPTNNPIVCSINFPGYLGDLKAALQATTPQAGAPAVFAAYFRQWYTLCTVSNPVVGSYFLQIETATKANGSSTPNGGGANRFAIRAGIGGSYTTTSVRVYGEARMGIYANAPTANTTFYLARLLPGAAGRNLVISFFDVGDAPAGSTGTLTVLPPPDSNVGLTFTGCTYTPPPGNSTGPPWGTFTATVSGCKITGVSAANYNGQWIQFKVPIPNNYDCALNDPQGCWTRINFAFTGNVLDTTTWSARIEGDPLRLIE